LEDDEDLKELAEFDEENHFAFTTLMTIRDIIIPTINCRNSILMDQTKKKQSNSTNKNDDKIKNQKEDVFKNDLKQSKRRCFQRL
jgi:hypothetical protein